MGLVRNKLNVGSQTSNNYFTIGRGKGTKQGEGKGSKLGEPCPKVRLSQDRLPIEPPFFLSLTLSLSLSLSLS